jgi:hypothetical protein
MIREVGERAGVDAAHIARSFDRGPDLYVAAVAAKDADGLPGEWKGLEQIADVVVGSRADRRGPGPDPSGDRPLRNLR